MQIDTTEAVDVYYPGFFQRMPGLGARAEIG
jgi:5-enolpyruvylshikimate-3-phosphate synthase